MSGGGDYISEFLKSNDKDRYYATLILPEESREAAQALFAFNADISQISERVSEPGPGEIRLQWWVDFLEGAEHGAGAQNPLAGALSAAIDRFDLPTGPLRRLLAARRFDLYDDPMPDMNSFEGYAGETNSILYQFTTLILNKGNEAGAAKASGHLGVAHALIGHLRAMGNSAQRGKIFLPWADLAGEGVTQKDYFARQPTKAMLSATSKLRITAGEHLALATEAIADLPAHIRPAFASICLLRAQLQRLDEFEALPFVAPPEMNNWKKIAKLVWWTWRA